MINEEYAKKYCCEDLSLIENYDKAIADTTQTWICHHILGEQYDSKYLIDNNLYENRPACEFRFFTLAEHNSLHFKGVTRGPMSEAHKKAIGEAHSKKVLQFTKSVEFIREWPSTREAGRELGITNSHICGCCNGKLKSAGGYIWKYA